ncbi:MAG TPA: cation-translocating P-type ATPase [Jiangellaceae bacterium]
MTGRTERADRLPPPDGAEHWWQSRPVRWSAAAGVLLAVGFASEQLTAAPAWIVTAAYVVAALVGARFFAVEALTELARERKIGIELLMTTAAAIAGVLGMWEEAAALAFLYSISEALEEFTEDRTRGAIRRLMDLAPKRVRRLDAAGAETEVGLEELAVADRFVVRPGETVATDGTVLEGVSAVNEAAVTGENVPVEKEPGTLVFAGTLNTTGALIVKATATVEHNTLAKIVHLVTEAQERKGRGELFMTRFARLYSPAVLALGVLVAVAGGILTADWTTWLTRAAVVLVAAAPCALVISIPITYVAAMGRAGRRGVLIKGGVHLEELAKVTVVALDKTGTITANRPRLVAAHPAAGVSEAGLLRLAAAAEARSEHPLAKAVLAAAGDRGIDVPTVDEFTALPGAGARARLDGRRLLVGSPALMTSRSIALDQFTGVVTGLQDQAATAIVLAETGPDGERVLGVLGIADTIREEASAAIAALRHHGVDRVVILTGDNTRAARVISDQVGADEYYAELKPQDKATAVAGLQAEHGHVAMVGDGINDAPALAAADVGIAMGAAGSDVAIETADVALMGDDLDTLAEAVRIGRRTRTVVRQNVTLGLAILTVLVPGALLGVLSLPAAVLAHEITEILVIANGVRMARA